MDGIEYSSSKISLASMNNDEKVLYVLQINFTNDNQQNAQFNFTSENKRICWASPLVFNFLEFYYSQMMVLDSFTSDHVIGHWSSLFSDSQCKMMYCTGYSLYNFVRLNYSLIPMWKMLNCTWPPVTPAASRHLTSLLIELWHWLWHWFIEWWHWFNA